MYFPQYFYHRLANLLNFIYRRLKDIFYFLVKNAVDVNYMKTLGVWDEETLVLKVADTVFKQLIKMCGRSRNFNLIKDSLNLRNIVCQDVRSVVEREKPEDLRM